MIHFGMLHISSYSLLALVGMIAFTITSIFILEKIEHVHAKITNRILVISVFGFISLAVFAFAFNSIFHSIEQGRIVMGGITWLGGVIGSFPLMVLMIHKFCPYIKGEALEYFNLLIPGIVLAHGFGRVGCFLGGCCYGRQTNSFVGVRFPSGSPAAEQYPTEMGYSLPVFPTQIYEALFEFLLFVIMIVLYKKLKRCFLEVYCISYGIFRFFIEFIRGDSRGATGFFLSPSQMMSLILILGGITVILYRKNIVFKKLRNHMFQYRDRPKETSLISKKEIRLLRELKLLLDEGVITPEEFEEKKKELLERI